MTSGRLVPSGSPPRSLLLFRNSLVTSQEVPPPPPPLTERSAAAAGRGGAGPVAAAAAADAAVAAALAGRINRAGGGSPGQPIAQAAAQKTSLPALTPRAAPEAALSLAAAAAAARYSQLPELQTPPDQRSCRSHSNEDGGATPSAGGRILNTEAPAYALATAVSASSPTATAAAAAAAGYPAAALREGPPRRPPPLEEEWTGHLAATDPTSLPKIYAGICREDVGAACEKLEAVAYASAAYRWNCSAKERRLGREQAAQWRNRQRQQKARRERREQEAQQQVLEEVDEESKKIDDQGTNVRWKRAFVRLKGKDSPTKEVAEDGTDTAEQGRQAVARMSRTPSVESLESVRGTKQGSVLQRSTGGLPLDTSSPTLGIAAIPEEPQGHGLGSRARGGGRGHGHGSGGHEEEGHGAEARPESKRTAWDVHRGSAIFNAVMKVEVGWKRNRLPPDQQLDLLRHARRLKKTAAKKAATTSNRKARFSILPPEEIIRYHCAFSSMGADPESHHLDAVGLRECAVEVGLGGSTVEEQLGVILFCEEMTATLQEEHEEEEEPEAMPGKSDAAQQEGQSKLGMRESMVAVFGKKFSNNKARGASIYDFAVAVVPQLRNHLQEVRADKVEQYFNAECAQKNGATLQQSVELALDFLVPSMAAGTNDERMRGQRELTSAGVATAKKLLERHGSDEMIPVLGGRRGQRLDGLRLTFPELLVVSRGVAEELQRNRHDLQRRIVATTGLDEHVFKQIRPDCITLHGLWESHALGSGSGRRKRMSKSHVEHLLLDFGCSLSEAQSWSEEVSHFGDLAFLVQGIQEDHCTRYQELHALRFRDFVRRDKNTGPLTRLAPQHVASFLREADVADANFPHAGNAGCERHVARTRQLAKCRPPPEAIAGAVQEALLYSRNGGSFDLREVALVRRRAQEAHMRAQRMTELRVVDSFGFKSSLLEDFHEAFEQLDNDASGFLELHEMIQAVAKAGIVASRETCTKAFQELDTDGNKCLDFVEFLALVQMLGEQKGPFEKKDEGLHRVHCVFDGMEGAAQQIVNSTM